MRRVGSNRSTIRSTRKCYLCPRNELSVEFNSPHPCVQNGPEGCGGVCGTIFDTGSSAVRRGRHQLFRGFRQNPAALTTARRALRIEPTSLEQHLDRCPPRRGVITSGPPPPDESPRPSTLRCRQSSS